MTRLMCMPNKIVQAVKNAIIWDKEKNKNQSCKQWWTGPRSPHALGHAAVGCAAVGHADVGACYCWLLYNYYWDTGYWTNSNSHTGALHYDVFLSNFQLVALWWWHSFDAQIYSGRLNPLHSPSTFMTEIWCRRGIVCWSYKDLMLYHCHCP